MDDEDEKWGPWTTHVPESAFSAAPHPHMMLPTSSRAQSIRRPAAGAQAASGAARAGNPAASAGGRAQRAPSAGGRPVARSEAAAHASTSQPGGATRSGSGPLNLPPRLESPAALDFEELWAGPRSAWDMAAMRRGLVTSLPPTSPSATLPSPSTAQSHISTKLSSQDRLSDLVGGGSLDGCGSVSRSSRASAAPAALRDEAAALRQRGPPLVARARTSHVKCEVPMWLPDSNGTVAAMGAPRRALMHGSGGGAGAQQRTRMHAGPGGAHIMLRR